MNVYEQLFAEEDARRRATVRVALDTKPDTYAAQKRDAKVLGLPAAAVEADPRIHQDVYAKLIDEDLAKSPSLGKQMLSPDFAKLAHDDTGALAAVEGAVANVARELAGSNARGQSVLRALPAGVADLSKGLYQMGGAVADVGAQLLEPLARLTNADNPLRAVSDAMRYGAQAAQATSDAIATPIDRDGRDDTLISRSMNSAARSVGQSVVPLGAGVAGAVATGSRAVGTAALTAQSLSAGGEGAAKAKDEGLSPLRALGTGLADASFEQVGNMVGFNRLLNDTLKSTGVFKTAARQLLPEIVGENATTALQDFNAWATLPSNRDKTFGDYLAARPAAAAETTLSVLFGAGGSAALSRSISVSADAILKQQRDAAFATEDAAKLGALMAAAAKSKLRDRDPESFAQLVQQAAEDRPGTPAHVYIDASVLLGADGGKGLVTREELAQLMPTITDQHVVEALATGGALELPVGDLAARVAGTPLEQSLLDHVRTAPDALSRSEAKSVESQTAEMSGLATSVAEQASAALTTEKERESVRANVAQQLQTAGHFTPDVNAVYAQVTADLFSTLAGRVGMTPSQMYAKYPLRIAGAPMLGDTPRVFEQSDAKPQASTVTDKQGDKYSVTVTPQVFGQGQTKTNSVMVEVRDPQTGERRGFVDFSLRDDGVLTSENTRVAKTFSGRGLAAAMYKAARDAGYDIAPGKVQTDEGLRMVEGLQRKGLINKEADGKRFRAGDLDLVPLEGGALQQAARGTFDPRALQITVLEKADLSTFLHELGHFGLEVMTDLAAQPDAPAGVVADVAALLRWFGIKAGDNKTALDTWRAMSLDEQRASHEKFAEAFEQYLFEGKAPTHDLQALFVKIRGWMTSVYRSLQQFLAGKESTLTPSVRGVFDRMLAAEDAIADAQRINEYAALFKDAAAANMSEDQFAAYLALGQQATDNAVSALTARSLRDMRWTANARAKALASEQKRVEGLRKAAEVNVRAQLAETPVEKARAAIRALRKEELKVSENAKQERAAWTTKYKTAESETREAHKNMPVEQRKLQVQQDMLQWELNNPAPQPEIAAGDLQIVAEMNGFSGVDEMQQTLAKSPSIEQEVEGLVDKQLLEEHGDTVTPGGMQRAADESVHNEARARFVATGLKALVDGARGDNGEKTSVAVLVKAAKQVAERVIGERPIRSISVQKFKAAEARAGKAALEATAKGDTRRAIAETRGQMLNNQLVRTATATLDEVDTAVKYLRGVSDSKTLDPDYRDQIDALLERFDLKEVSGTQAAKRKTLAVWVEEQRANGVEPELPADVLAEAYSVPYRDMSVTAFRGLVDSVKQIEHLGKLKKKLLLAKDKREFDAILDEMVESIHANYQGQRKAPRTDTTTRGRRIAAVKGYGAAHIKAATWARIADGGKDNGALWERIILPANERADFETTERAKAAKHLDAVLRPWMTRANQRGSAYFESIKQTLPRHAVFAIALNTGNEGNLQRLLDGEGWTMAQLQPVLATLTREDWAVVQQVWDHFDSYRPDIGAKQRRVYGTEPDWVQPAAQTHTLADGTTLEVKGGYFPITYDPVATARSEEQADAKSAEAQLRGARGSATTQRSFTKARAAEVKGRPLLYSLSTVYNGTEDIIHDLAWHEWLIDTNRILGNKKLDAAMRETHGPDVMQQLKKWRDAIAEGEGAAARDASDGWVAVARRNVSLSSMGFSFVTAAVQVTGFAQSAQRIGSINIARGLLHYIGNPVRAIREANEKSEFMRNRSLTQTRDLNEIRNRVQGDEKLRTFLQKYGFLMIQKMQSVVDVPTWHGAYEKAVAAGHDEERAIALSDQAVRDAQGSGQINDLSEVERGNEYKKLFTGFYTFMNVSLNLGVARGMSPGASAKKAADMLLLYALPAMLTVLLKNAITPGEDEEESLLQKYGKEQIGFLLGLFVGVRELQGLAAVATGSKMFDYSGPSGLRPIGETLKFAQQAAQGENDAALRKAAINMAGFIIGAPSAQINRTLKGAQALEDDATQNPAALLTGYQGR